MYRKILKISLIVMLSLVVIAFAAPFLFKGKIIAIAKEQINKNLNAKVDFSDLDISFFRHFPKVSVALQGLQVLGTGDFAKDTLVAAKDIDVALNLMSVVRGSDFKVYSITIHEPRIHVIVLKDGRANYNITKPDTAAAVATGQPSTFKMNLEKYAITNGYISYKDAGSGMSTEITNINHEGSGDFTADLFTLSTKTTADAVTFSYGGIPYLDKTTTAIDMDIQVDNKANKYSFKTDKIAVNELKLTTEGFFQLVNDSTYAMDLKFDAPSTDFRNILSLVPVVYQKDFAAVKTSGQALFNGWVKGSYSPTQIPAYHINLGIKDGFFQYPDLPKPLQHINVTMSVDNPDGLTDNTVVNIPQGHIEMDNEPFDFRLLLQHPMTSRYIDVAAKGKLDLSKITQFVKLDAGTKLSGLLNADIQAKGNIAAIQKQQAGAFSARGYLEISDLYYASAAFPRPIQHTSARIAIDNPDGVADHTVVQLSAAHAEIGNDILDATLLLKTPVSDPYFEGTAKGSFDLGNVKQFYAFEPGTSLAGLLKAAISFKGRKSFVDKKQYDAVATSGTIDVSGITYKSKNYPDGVSIHNSQLVFTPKNVTLNAMSGSFMQTNFTAFGSLDNMIGYALKDEPLAGTLNITADKLDLNKWMATDSTATSPAAASPASEPFAVPKNIQFTLNAKVDQLHYDKTDYNKVTGTLLIKDETVTLKNIQMQALDGNIGLNGSYATATPAAKKNPAISLSYDVQNLDVQKTFNAYNTVQKLMPAGKFISGRLNSKLTMKGSLGKDMMPNLSSLTGDGNLLLLQGVVGRFEPLQKLASTLHLDELKEITLKDIKNSFEFANGKVLVKPFNIKVKGIDMQIGGMHGIDQSIDYIINMKIPRALLGSQANALAGNLASQAAAKGIPVNLGETVNLDVKMGGTMTNPTISTGLKGAGGNASDQLKQQALSFAQAKADSAKQVVKDTIVALKNQALKEAKDQLSRQVLGAGKDSAQSPADIKKRAEDAGKGLMNNFFKKKSKDTTNQ